MWKLEGIDRGKRQIVRKGYKAETLLIDRRLLNATGPIPRDHLWIMYNSYLRGLYQIPLQKQRLPRLEAFFSIALPLQSSTSFLHDARFYLSFTNLAFEEHSCFLPLRPGQLYKILHHPLSDFPSPFQCSPSSRWIFLLL